MNSKDGPRVIEFYGDFARIGIEGKWVDWIFCPKPRPPRQELRDFIDEMDRERNSRSSDEHWKVGGTVH